MTQQKLEQLLEIFKQKYFQGDSYYCRFNNKGDKCIVGYKNDYPMQHGDGKEWQIPTEVADMLVSQIEPPVKPALGVKVSYILDIEDKRQQINKIPFKDLKLLDDNGMEIFVDEHIRQQWRFTGLNNTDYVSTCFYKQGFMGSDSSKSV